MFSPSRRVSRDHGSSAAGLKAWLGRVEVHGVSGRLSVAIGFALVAMTAAAAAAADDPAITEYHSGLPANASPLNIATGPEGDLWFTESGGAHAIGKATVGGVITSYPTEPSMNPQDIALGPDGKMWFTAKGGTNEIGTVNPRTGEIAGYALAGGSNPSGITAGAEGNVWFAVEGGPKGMIGRIVPSTGEITEFDVPTENSHPEQVTLGREGDIWFTENADPGAIGRFDRTTDTFVEYRAGLTEKSKPSGITTGPEGNIWFTEATNPGRIGRISPVTGAITEFSSGLTVGTPQDIVTGSDGNLYFTESNGTGALGQVTPSGDITQYAEGLTPNTQPWGITSGPDGNIWFVDRRNPAGVGTLKVAPKPGPPPAPEQPPAPAPSLVKPLPPVVGRYMGVGVVSGTVSVRIPPSSTFVTIQGAETIPLGATLDATHGVVRVVTALPGGGSQSVVASEGAFQVFQKATGMTDLFLRGPALSCGRRASASSAKKRPVASRKLWAEDDHGRYASYGSYSATTVLGTRWETVDTCAGTLTRVARGEVHVSDRYGHKTVLVSAGHSYLTRP